jgi:hypothetical protein
LVAGNLEQALQNVGRLPVGQPAPEVAVLGHRDLRVPELVADPPRRDVGVVKRAASGGAAGYAGPLGSRAPACGPLAG